MPPIKRPALFLDRDGVIIENRPDYVRSWADVQFLPGALQALAGLRERPEAIILVTNQSAVGRGLLSLDQAIAINQRLLAVIRRAGGRVDAVYLCPHAPRQGCTCRKPRPGLLLQAAERQRIDLADSALIGDALSDIKAGRAAGLARTVLVRTGRGREQEQRLRKTGLPEVPVVEDLPAAIETLFK